MIIEFNGLPGSGKTLLKKQLAQTMHGRDILTAGVDEFRGVGSSKLKKHVIKAYRIMAPFFFNNFSFWSQCRKLLQIDRSEIPYQSRYEKMIVVAYLVYLLQTYRCQNKIVIVDEGFVQTFSAIAVHTNSGEKAAEVIRNVCSQFDDILSVNIDISIEDTYENIQNRNRHDSAMDSMSDEKLKQFLQQYDKRLNEMRSVFPLKKVLNIQFKQSEVVNMINTIIERIAEYE